MITLHPQLAQDTIVLGRFELCHLLLMNDENYPWCILVPDREDITEIYQLSRQDQHLLTQESAQLAQALTRAFNPDKLNIAALGNIVPQLHIHHVARYTTDIAWPAPIWGKFNAKPYTEETRQTAINKLKEVNLKQFNWIE